MTPYFHYVSYKCRISRLHIYFTQLPFDEIFQYSDIFTLVHFAQHV